MRFSRKKDQYAPYSSLGIWKDAMEKWEEWS